MDTNLLIYRNKIDPPYTVDDVVNQAFKIIYNYCINPLNQDRLISVWLNWYDNLNRT